jgi:hypothetical protein
MTIHNKSSGQTMDSYVYELTQISYLHPNHVLAVHLLKFSNDVVNQFSFSV